MEREPGLRRINGPARRWLVTGAVLGGLAVACGAFAAHGLKKMFAAGGTLSADDLAQLANWETAARYQFFHALALVAVGLLAAHRRSRLLDGAGWTMTLGTVIFCGCLYALTLTGQRWLGRIVPIGGVLMIVGWVLLALAAAKHGDDAQADRTEARNEPEH